MYARMSDCMTVSQSVCISSWATSGCGWRCCQVSSADTSSLEALPSMLSSRSRALSASLSRPPRSSAISVARLRGTSPVSQTLPGDTPLQARRRSTCSRPEFGIGSRAAAGTAFSSITPAISVLLDESDWPSCGVPVRYPRRRRLHIEAEEAGAYCSSSRSRLVSGLPSGTR